jgi:hypothetical protein
MNGTVATPSKKPGEASDGANHFSFTHENCEKLKKYHQPKLTLKTILDSHTNVGITIILRLLLFYTSRN